MTRQRWLYALIFAIHVIISLIAFKDFRLHPSGITYSNAGDGMKNHFTLLSYVKEPIDSKGIFHYRSMNYPYGEYVFYTDNTPAFAVPFKWFCHHVYDLSDYTLAIFQVTLILGIILSGLLCFFIFRKLLRNDRLAFILAVILPWTNIQVVRIWRGHFNLSYSFLILLAIALSILWHEYHDRPGKRWWIFLSSVLLGFSGFFIHGYYLPIVTGFQAAIWLLYGIYQRKNKNGRQSIIAGIILPLVTAGLAILLLLAGDAFYQQRSATASGYGMEDSKVHFGSLLTSYDFYKSMPFFIKDMHWGFDPENMAFLGSCGLYMTVLVFILMLAGKDQRARFHSLQKEFFTQPLTAAIAIAGLIMLFISMGETYTTSADGFTITNILNPFLYLHALTNRVEQFRCIGRFAWPFFFSFNVWAFYTLAGMIQGYGPRGQWLILIAAGFIGSMEIRDYADKFQAESKENKLAGKAIYDLDRLQLDYSRYQAFVPIPFYSVGSESADYVIDDDDSVALFSYQLHMRSQLPMMACKMSRTVPEQAHSILALLASDSLTQDMNSRLNNKPLLICYNRNLASRWHWAVPHSDRPRAKEYYYRILDLPCRHQLVPIDSTGDMIFYEWNPKTQTRP